MRTLIGLGSMLLLALAVGILPSEAKGPMFRDSSFVISLSDFGTPTTSSSITGPSAVPLTPEVRTILREAMTQLPAFYRDSVVPATLNALAALGPELEGTYLGGVLVEGTVRGKTDMLLSVAVWRQGAEPLTWVEPGMHALPLPPDVLGFHLSVYLALEGPYFGEIPWRETFEPLTQSVDHMAMLAATVLAEDAPSRTFSLWSLVLSRLDDQLVRVDLLDENYDLRIQEYNFEPASAETSVRPTPETEPLLATSLSGLLWLLPGAAIGMGVSFGVLQFRQYRVRNGRGSAAQA